MSDTVVDSSVAAKWVLPEPDSAPKLVKPRARSAKQGRVT